MQNESNDVTQTSSKRNEPVKLFTLSPMTPVHDPAPPDDHSPYARAFVNFRNIQILAFGGAGKTKPSLHRLSLENWIYFSSSRAAPPEEDTASLQNWETSALIEIAIQVFNLPAEQQLLLRLDLNALGSHGRVRVGLAHQVLATHHVGQHADNIVNVLLPISPKHEWLYVDFKHIQTDDHQASALRFNKVEGFLT